MLHVHRAELTTDLAAGVAAILAAAPDDPFTPDVVAVPTKGVERWLAQRLAHHLGATDGDGICANVVFPSPASMLAEALAAGSEVDPDDDPWEPARSTWWLLPVIDDAITEPWCTPLAAHLRSGGEAPGRRLATAQRLARLFHRYAVARPQLLRDWAAGRDTDGAGAETPHDLAWQPHLWRRLRAATGTESPAERLPAAIDHLRRHPETVDLPARLSLFGPTRLTTAELELLDALATHRDVHLWLPHPSPALWQSLAAHATAGPRRRDHAVTLGSGNTLLASLGRDVRELQLRLALHAPDHTDEHIAAADAKPATVLGRLQQAIVENAEPARSTPIAPPDRSLQVHACHGPARQVEVLREVLVGLLADDPTLEPRDVLVMCPDVEDYAPLISATFGLVADDDSAWGDHHPGHRLRVRLADRSLRQTNPMLGLVAALLDLASARVTATMVLDLAALAPVRRKFRFDDDDLETLSEWVAGSGVRWGLDAQQRAAFGLDHIAQNTWQAGIERILLGAAMAEDDLRWIGRVLPLDDVDSNDIDLAGRLAELVSRLSAVIGRLTGSRSLTEWAASLVAGLDLLGEVSEADSWQTVQARRELADLVTNAGERADTVPLRLGDVTALMADRLAGRPTRANFRTGHLTMCSMVPMRSVPHRVICLLGLDDGAFPRGSGVDGDDVLARDPCLGERDPRSEDRQLLLDAILAAREHLVILYTGADPRTNSSHPPAVPVGEILDALDALACASDGRSARSHVVTHHPLQPFDDRNFVAGALVPNRPFSFDAVALRGAKASLQPRIDPPPLVTAALPEPPSDTDILLDDLIAFFEHPARAFLRQRLGATLLGDEPELDDDIPVELAGLGRYQVGERIVRSFLTGHDVGLAIGAEWRRGTLPPREIGTRAVNEDLRPQVETIAAACGLLAQLPDRGVDVVVDLAAGRLTGTVRGLRDHTVLRATFATLAAKHRLRAWLQLLVLTVAIPAEEWTAVTIGRDGQRVRRCTLGPVEPGIARMHLVELVALYRDGLCRPLPMAPKTSSDYASRRCGGADEISARADAERVWAHRDYPERDDAWQWVWGVGAPLAALCADPAQRAGDESTRFGEVAHIVWGPLLDAETRERF